MTNDANICSTGKVDLRLALEQAGWRHTRQRAEVFAYLHAVGTHPTAEQVFAAVRRHIPNISLATVYKALEALVDAGLAAQLADDQGGPVRYDGRAQPHYHLRCERTGQVHDLDLPYDPALIERLAPGLVEDLHSKGFEILGHRLEVIGRFRASSQAGEER
jgi:Fe2+ or Zn2+ uptake regulation protein